MGGKSNAKHTRDHKPCGDFAPGNRASPGRPKGSKNRVNKSLTDQILGALEDLGGEEYLRALSKPLYISLLRTIAPRTVHQDSTIRFEDGLAEIDKGQEELGTDEIGLTPVGDAVPQPGIVTDPERGS